MRKLSPLIGKINAHVKGTGVKKAVLVVFFAVSYGTGLLGGQTENYAYDGSGNLIKKGTLNYTYNPANHAVTKVTSPETGDINYIYDASGNMTSRAGDSFQYDSMGRLAKASLSNNTNYELTYDWQNQKIKKLNTKDQGTVYSIDGFELTRLPGQTEKHTVYVRGQQGELVAQLTLGESRLVAGGGSSEKRIASGKKAKRE